MRDCYDVIKHHYNAARLDKKEAVFTDTKIDYLTVPHHGVERTDHQKIMDDSSVIKTGTMDAIYFIGKVKGNQPDKDYLAEVEKRFDVI